MLFHMTFLFWRTTVKAVVVNASLITVVVLATDYCADGLDETRNTYEDR
jgi:hypothetical protein